MAAITILETENVTLYTLVIYQIEGLEENKSCFAIKILPQSTCIIKGSESGLRGHFENKMAAINMATEGRVFLYRQVTYQIKGLKVNMSLIKIFN